ncbi:MAG: type VI secretion system protein TssA [Planctomycetota bacterium]
MSVIDVDKLLLPVSGDAPSGTNLEYDPAFTAMEQAAQGQPERVMGEQKIEAVPPDWRVVKQQAIEVLGRSKDLRAAVYLTRALIHTDGFKGLERGLALVVRLVADFWSTVHPELDPDDQLDPTMRVNILGALADREATLDAVQRAPLVSSRGLGSFAMVHVQVASGELPPPPAPAEPPTMAMIDAAFMDGDLDSLEQTRAALAGARGQVKDLEAQLTAQVGGGRAISFDSLARALAAAEKVVVERLARRGVGGGDLAAAVGDGAGGEAGPQGAGVRAGAPVQRVTGEITSREDVVRLLDQICTYFERSEPSSPVPILLRRAKGLVSKNFMDILSDLAPDGLPQAQIIRGHGPGEGG